jgi:AraC-like DNA-binding protein
LSLGSLSRRIHENEHYVSQVINQELKTSFYEYVNAHRIEHAKQLLIESPDQNVLDIALSVGFNTKSTFNSAFRRHTGITPREFRAQARSQTGRIAPLND